MKTCALLLSLLLTLVGCPAWAECEIVKGPDGRSEIDLRIEALDAERAKISTWGPSVTTVVGLVMTVTGGIVLGALAPQCPVREADGCRFGGIMAGGALTGIGLVTTLTGGIVWGVRADRRSKLEAERDSLIKERDGLAATLSRLELRSPYRDGTQFVTLGVRF